MPNTSPADSASSSVLNRLCSRAGTMAKVFNRNTALVQWGSVLSGIAGSTTYFVFAWWVLQSTGSITQFGSILTVATVLQTALQLFAGALGDRLGPLLVMRRAVLIQAVLVAVLAAAVAVGSYSFPLAVLVSGLLAIANGLTMAMNNPLLAEMAPEGKLTEVLAQRGSLASAAKLVGPTLAAALLAATSGAGAMLAALALCVTGSFMVGMVHPDGKAIAREENAAEFGGIMRFGAQWLKDSVAGVVAFSRVRVDFLLCLVTCGVNVGLPAYFAVLVPYQVITTYKLPASYLGVFDAFFCAGMMLGGMKTVGWLNGRVGKINAIVISVAVLSLMVLSIGFSSEPAVLALSQFLGGCFMLSIFVNIGALRALATPKTYRARVMTSAAFLTSMSMGPGIALCTWILHSFGSHAAVLAMAGIILLSVLAIYLIPNAVSVLSLSEDEAKGAYARLYPHAFGSTQ